MGNKTYLPANGTAEYQELVAAYPMASKAMLKTWARKYGYASHTNLIDAMFRRLGISRRNPDESVTPLITMGSGVERVPYPDFKIKPFNVGEITRDVEDIGIVFADRHDGKKTESYDLATSRRRTDVLMENTSKIINLHRPIRKAWVFELGDGVQGENPYQGSKIGETECGAYEQIETYGVPMRASFLVSLSQDVEEVEYVGVSGNHGVYDRIATQRTNWDNFLYASLQKALINQKNIKINIPLWFYQLVNIRGFRFFLIHGNQVTAMSGIPLFAMRRKMQEWYAYVGGFDYAYAGHFHSGANDQVNSEADYTIAPPLVTGDSWALEKVGRASKPIQLCFGVHDKYGRTFRYDLHTDDKFLPKRFDEPEGVVEL